MPHTVAAQAKLLVKLQGQGSRTLDLATDSFTIGRKADNDLAIDDQTISSRHARIVKVQSVFFVEDLKSTNGTSVNGKRIERHQLRDADVISIGQHRLIFQDNVAVSAPSTTPVDMDQTVVLHGQDRMPTRSSAVGHLVVTSGKTDQLEYTLAQQVALIGAQNDAAIRLTGWFVPKAAARISRRGASYTISPVQRTKKVRVNGTEIVTQQELKNGDQIEVAGVTFSFSLTAGEKIR